MLADGACLTREVTVPWGTVPGASAAASYIGELSVHSWDLATALGMTGVLNDALATEIVCILRYKRHQFMAKGIHAQSVAAEFAR